MTDDKEQKATTMGNERGPTDPDSNVNEWAIDDDVLQLRAWATNTSYTLPLPPVQECTIGAARNCEIRIHDPLQYVSRVHGGLSRVGRQWLLRDLDSKNGLRIDGARRLQSFLTPGLEIGIGSITLIAESRLSIALRDFLTRLIGWSASRAKLVDRALRSIRLAATRRTALVLCGEGDLVPMALSIHQRARGTHQPFIVCDPRRRLSAEATVRAAANDRTGLAALSSAAGGSLCIRSRRLPEDFHPLIEALRGPNSRVQLIVCADTPEVYATCRMTPIVIPPLAGRKADLDRIINEYADDAMAELGRMPFGFPPEDLAWVRKHGSKSLQEIEKATRRLVALRMSSSLSNAAMKLRMAPVSLSRWIGRRALPMKLDD